jgi:hypothetical protein
LEASYTVARELRWLLVILFVASAWTAAHAQVSPAEITNPQLKAAEETYLSQITALYRDINVLKAPFRFQLNRYVSVDPGRDAVADSRGIEFVHFQYRLVLKTSGSYGAAYSGDLLTQNQRASRVFSDVIEPILALVVKRIPEDVSCDDIGFEIAYHVRSASRNFDYEGREILVVVFDRAAAFAFGRAGSDAERQDILNRSKAYLDGKPFGLALGKSQPFDLETMSKMPAPQTESATAAGSVSSIQAVPLKGANAPVPAPPSTAPMTTPSPATAADVNRLQEQFQAKLDAFASAGRAKFHFVNYAPPSFILYRNQVLLQMTLRNPTSFSPDSSSIYKRAAQSFDLFLARQLKDLLDAAPADAPVDGYDITVLNQVGSDPGASSEAIEFVCPRTAIRQFVDADVTNQQLIDMSVVLVNGVRIALNLQLVE